MAKRPSVPRRLRGAHPRRADGRFIKRSIAKGLITRIKRKRQQQPPEKPRQHPKRRQQKRRQQKRTLVEKLPKETERPPETEFAVSASYKKRAGHDLMVQLSIFTTHARATPDDVHTAIQHKIDTGDDPDGYRLTIVNWRAGKREGGPMEWSAFRAPLGAGETTYTDPKPIHSDEDRESEGDDEK